MLAKNERSIARWENRLKASSFRQNLYYFNDFMRWLDDKGEEFRGFGPDDLVEYQKKASGEERYKLLDLVELWIHDKEGRHGYKRRLYATLRSFFLHNRAELPKDPGFRLRPDKPKVVGTLTIEEFKRVLFACNRKYRALFLCMFQGGLDSASLIYWSQHGLEDLRTSMRGEECPIRVDLPGRKSEKFIRPFYSFIHRDAIVALREYLDHREYESRFIFASDPRRVRGVDRNQTYPALHVYWTRRLEIAGLIERANHNKVRYGKNPHELRDLFRTRWEKSGSSPVGAEFCMGHTVDPLEYNKAFRDEQYTRKLYNRASGWLNILSEDPTVVDAYRVETLEAKLQEKEREIQSLESKLMREIQDLRYDFWNERRSGRSE